MHRALAVSVALATSLAALATSAQAGTHWNCVLSDDAVRLVCVADEASTAAAEPEAPRTVVNGTVFPLDARRRYVVDLWSPPDEWAFVDRLARATICYRSPGCSVNVADWRTPAQHAAR
ncbi:MAG: hypothetical protein KF788_21330 [Piscinibacter sp.]|nr:hypothetical protein [Piscinibacter sp.]